MLVVVVIWFYWILSPVSRDYLEVEQEVRVTGEIRDIADTDSGQRITLGNVHTINGTRIEPGEYLLVSVYSDNNSTYNTYKKSNFISSSYNHSESGSAYISNNYSYETSEHISGKNKLRKAEKKSSLFMGLYSEKSEVEKSEKNDGRLRIGNNISVSGKAKPFELSGNPGQFNAYSYYRGKGYAYQVKAKNIDVIDDGYDHYREFIRRISDKVSEAFHHYLPEKDAGMMSAMVLGNRNCLDENDKELYKEDGLMHLLAVSALHVSMISTIIIWLISRLPVNFVTGRFIVIIALCVYGSIAGYSVSCSRAIIMLICSIVAGVTGNTYDRLSALSLSGTVILLADPGALFSPDYLLSFGAVISIMIVSYITDRIQFRSDIIKTIVCSLCVSMGVAYMTMPVILYNYYDVPLYSVLLNLIVIPVMPLLFVAGVACGVLGVVYLALCGSASTLFAVFISGLSDKAACFLAGTVHYILEAYRWVCERAADICYDLRITGCPDNTAIIIYYIIVALCLIIIYRCIINDKNTIRTLLALCTLLLVLLPCIVFCHDNNGNDLVIDVIDVGQGDGIYIEMPDDTSFFIDGGSSDVSSLGRYRLKPFLMYNGRRRIDTWIITHGDSDHYSGFMEMLDLIERDRFEIGELWLADTGDPGEGYRNIEDRAKELDIPVVKMSAGMCVRSDRYSKECHEGTDNVGTADNPIAYSVSDYVWSLTCINPVKNMANTGENEYSLVLLLRCGNFTGMFTGDVEKAGEETLLDYCRNNRLDLSMLKVPHHGSAHSTSMELLDLLKPETAVISCGRNNRYGHPHEELLERLDRAGAGVYRTDMQGAVMVRSDGERYGVETWKESMK